MKTITMCDDILGNMCWGQKPRNDCRLTLIAISFQDSHDALAHRHAEALRQHEEHNGNGRLVFCAPLTSHWDGRSKHAGKRSRASEGVFVERRVV